MSVFGIPLYPRYKLSASKMEIVCETNTMVPMAS